MTKLTIKDLPSSLTVTMASHPLRRDIGRYSHFRLTVADATGRELVAFEVIFEGGYFQDRRLLVFRRESGSAPSQAVAIIKDAVASL